MLPIFLFAVLGLAAAGPQPAAAADWPTWRHDAARSARSPLAPAENLHLQWVREMPAPARAWRHQWDDLGKLDFDVSWSPVVAGELVFVPSSVTDSVTAYRLGDGTEKWRFYAGGPVRLAPAAWRGRLYFVSDDGYLYCLDAVSGALHWKFRAGPAEHYLLGNERLVSFWAARGGPVIDDGVLYFAAGLWPQHGIFVYALEAENGTVKWVNDSLGSDYHSLPHGGASGLGGFVPQGYLAVAGERLVVAGGRTPPLILDRHTGAVVSARLGSKGGGGYAVHGVDGGGAGLRRNHDLAAAVQALAGSFEGDFHYRPAGEAPACECRNCRLVEHGFHGDVFDKLIAHDRLLITMKDGTIYCFGPEETTPLRHEYRPGRLETRTGAWAGTARAMLAELDESGGYALMLGAGSGELLWELLMRGDQHIVVVEPDPRRGRALRERLAAAGLYGRRAAVIVADPASFRAQPYLFSLVVSEDLAAAGLGAEKPLISPVLEWLRPYGGIAWLGADAWRLPGLAYAAESAAVDQVSVERRPGHLFARRAGPLTGAGQWTHQYHDPANTLISREERARMPLGVLWFGGPTHDNILPRHTSGPRPQVAGGRQVFLGVNTIAARCVYTGRALWEREFPRIGHPFTQLVDEENWARGHYVPMRPLTGATHLGSPFVTLPDSIYVRHEQKIYHLDPASGSPRNVFPLPGRPVGEIYDDEDPPEWGHLSVQGDYLITTAEPHLFGENARRTLGARNYDAISGRRLIVMDRHEGKVLWQREAEVAFRHQSIVSHGETLFLVDGFTENVVALLARRGEEPPQPSAILALDLRTGAVRWRTDSQVFGTFLVYTAEHDILLEGGNRDRRPVRDEPGEITARRGHTGEILWEGGTFRLPGAVRGDLLISGRGGAALCLLSGEPWRRERPGTDDEQQFYQRRYSCDTFNASSNFLLFRTGSAGYFDLEHETGTGNFSGFRAGCTSNMIAADGVVSALDYTRTCICSYAHQTSLAFVHMPGDDNLESWTLYAGAPPDPAGHGLNPGAPGRRHDRATGRTWHELPGTHRRHPSAVAAGDDSPAWVAASGLEGEETIVAENLLEARYLVRLHFAELAPETTAGQRVFDVLVNGETVLAGFDIVAAAGGPGQAVTREFTLALPGRAEIQLRRDEASALDPFLGGIEFIALR